MKLAVIGAGIGGLAAGLAMKRRAMDVTIFEQADTIRAVGAGILMPPNAMRILECLGVGELVSQSGVPLQAMGILSQRGRTLMEISQISLGQRFGDPTVSIKRSDLHGILARAIGPETIQLGQSCRRVTQGEGGVNLEFASGARQRFDAVIGADGLRSACRKTIGDSRPLRYSGQTCLRGITHVRLPRELRNQAAEVWGNGIRFGCSPVGEDEIYWYATIVSEPGITLESSEALRFLQRRFNQFPAFVRDVIASIRAEEIIHGDLSDLQPGENWVFGRIALLGDAAHATTPNLGQGAAMAIEDAWVLAEELTRESDPECAFRKYNQKRKDRVMGIVRRSWNTGRLAGIRNPLLCRLRNLAAASMPQVLLKRELDRIYGWEDRS